MKQLAAWAFAGAAAAVWCWPAPADPPLPKPPTDVNLLALEIEALRTVAGWELSDRQAKEFLRFAEGAADPRKRDPAKVSVRRREALQKAHATLLGKDEDARAEAQQAMDDAAADEDAGELDDGIDRTAKAAEHAAAAVSELTAPQLANWLSQVAVEDPIASLIDALEAVREPAMGETADELAARLAGDIADLVDKDRAEAVRGQALALLKKAAALDAAAFARKQPKLAEEAAALGPFNAFATLRRCAERAMAETLSNPRFRTALERHLQTRGL